MNKIVKKALLFISVIIICFTSFTVSASTYLPYNSYEYNTDDKSVAAPAGYEVDRIIKASDLGIQKDFNSLSDLYFDNKDTFYLLDSGNGRIILTDSTMKLKKIIESFQDTTGKIGQIDITGAQGICVDSNYLYIADTEHQRILISDFEGNVIKQITRPESALLNSDIPFSVDKVLLDGDGRIYALAKSINLGAFIFDGDGRFLNFWGGNEVAKTSEVIFNYFRKNFMSAEQIAGMKQATPVSFSNFDIDKSGFVYTVTDAKDKDSDTKSGIVRILNFKGLNILATDKKIGDLEEETGSVESLKNTAFCDVDVDENGFVNLLDEGRGKVFQYSEDGDLITVFGSYSEQKGGFGALTAIESYKDCVYVADSQKNCITVFKQTQYASYLRSAIVNLKNNKMDKAFEYFQKVHMLNSNSLYPYYGMGLVYDAEGKYSEAMQYFKIANAKEEYSQSFKEYRSEFFNQHAIQIVLLIVVIFSVIVLVKYAVKKKVQNSTQGEIILSESKKLFPLYTLFHPVDGFGQFKPRKIASYPIALIFIFSWFVIETLGYFLNGYCFNDNTVADYNIFIQLGSTIGIFLLFVIANWAACALLDGKGTFKDIFCTCSYSLIPMLSALLVNVALTNIFSMDETVYVGLVNAIGLIWSGLLLLCGLMTIHQYSLKKTIGSIIVTIFGILIIIFIMVLFLSLIQQIFNFVSSVSMEASLR